MGLSLQDIVFLNKGHSNKTSPKQYVASFTNYPSQKKRSKFFKQGENTAKSDELLKNLGENFSKSQCLLQKR